MSDLFELQNGNRGFAEFVNRLIMVSADLQGFTSEGERHQAWTDGGMFSMSLVYALHSLGVGTCCLNLCHGVKTDKAMKKAAKIPASEVLVMMIAVGHLPGKFKVAASPRKPLQEVFFHVA